MTIPSEFQRFPKNWDVLPFPEAVRDATSGNSKIPKGEYLESGMYPIVDQGQRLYGGYTDDSSLVASVGSPAIVFGDHTRAFKYIESDFCLGADGAKILEPKARLDKRFLFHYLKQLRIESAGYSRHFKFLKETFVPVPPLKEQKRIAAILDKADSIRRKRQQSIQLADEFLRSVFLDKFGDPVTNPKGWDIYSWNESLRIVNGKNQKNVESDDGKYPICGSGGEMSRADDWLTKECSVIIGRKGNINKPILMKEKFWNVDTAFGLEPNTNFLSHNYLYWYCRFFDFERLNKAVTIPSLTKADLLEIKMPVPEYNEQVRFGGVVERVESLLGKNNAFAGVPLFESLSQKAFSGEL